MHSLEAQKTALTHSFPRRISAIRALLLLGSKVKLYKLLSFTIVRQHRLWASDASIWPRLTAYDARIHEIHHAPKPVLWLCSGSVT